MSSAANTSACRSETAMAHRRAVSRAIATMRDRLDENLSLRDLAEVAYISPYHFNRVFRQLAGIPPGQFLSALRLQRAKRLLLTTEMSVTDICFEVGYNSLGTFTRRFNQLVGMPPRQLRVLVEGRAGAHRKPGPRRPPTASSTDVAGWVRGPDGFSGVAFIGLFPDFIPQGRPVACTVAPVDNPFHVQRVPDGEYFLLAAGLPASTDPREQILCEEALRGGGHRLEVQGGEVRGRTDVKLRPPEVTDPPFLLTFPLLMRERLAERDLPETLHLPVLRDARSAGAPRPPS